MAKKSVVTRMPNRSPLATTKMYLSNRASQFPAPRGGDFTSVKISPDKPANVNRSAAVREQAIRTRYPQTNKIVSGKFAYGSKPSVGPSMGSRIAGAAGTVARGALRTAGPVGALVGMTVPAGAPKGHPAYEASTVRKTGSYGPLMKGNSKTTSRSFGGFMGPSKTTSRSSGGMRSGPGATGGPKTASKTASKTTSRSSGGMRSGPGASGGPKTASKTTSRSSGGMRSGPGATGGSKTAGRSSSSKPSRGTSRF